MEIAFWPSNNDDNDSDSYTFFLCHWLIMRFKLFKVHEAALKMVRSRDAWVA